MNIARLVVGAFAGIIGVVLALPAILLLVPIWWVDSLVRLFRRVLEPKPIPWEEVIEYAPEIGWKPKADISAHVLNFNRDTWQLTTDSDGWRGRGSVERADVVVFGDSYAFGYGVDDDAFFGDLPGDVRIKSIGSPAYSLVHSLMWMERMAWQLKGKLVVWFVYNGNDLADNIHPAQNQYRSPFVRFAAGDSHCELVTEHVDSSPWTLNTREGGMAAFIELCSPTEQSRRAFEACDYLIRRANDVCREVGARLVVMSIPDLSYVSRLALARELEKSRRAAHFDEEVPDRELNAICDRAGLQFVPLAAHMDATDYLERDFHWSPRGHRKVARLIGELSRNTSVPNTSASVMREQSVAHQVSSETTSEGRKNHALRSQPKTTGTRR